MAIWGQLMSAIAGFRDGWKASGIPTRSNGDGLDVYDRRWALYLGDAFRAERDLGGTGSARDGIMLYAGIRPLWSPAQSVVDFYASHVYLGTLSTDGQPLPEDRTDAIPIDPQTGKDETNQALRIAIAALWSKWNWQDLMTRRPMYGAALGDCLTELVDDVPRRSVLPHFVWPGHVVEIELDTVGNVKRYVLEYIVDPLKARPGEQQESSYRYRKEVDKEFFRYWKDDAPFNAFGEGSEVPNPYGFVPAVWDRHKAGWNERGMSALDGVYRALAYLNSFLSNAVDYQSKAFNAPVMVTGTGNLRNLVQTAVTTSGVDPKGYELLRNLVESVDYLPLSGDGSLLQLAAELGQTVAIVQNLQERILDEVPEARFFNALREQGQVTGPGAERALGDAVMRCRRARSGYDRNQVALHQMSISMIAYRTTSGAYGSDRPRWLEPFRDFTTDSYARGILDHSIIVDRPVVPITEAERLANELTRVRLAAERELIQTRVGLTESGYSDAPGSAGDDPPTERSEVDKLMAERQDVALAKADAASRMFNGGGFGLEG